MSRIKVLVSSEASYLNTGYGKYAWELLHYLASKPEYEVAEFAAYGTMQPNHSMYSPKIHEAKWKVYCNLPNAEDEAANNAFKSNPVNEFGKFQFEPVVLDFKPDVVLAFRDYWMEAHIDSSPFRRYYRWIYMPTIDTEPQKSDWLDCFRRADCILTYSDWAIESLKRQKFNGTVYKSAPPAGTVELGQVDQLAERKRLGIPEDAYVIGTVMRNQPRKLYDILFSAFAKFCKNKPDALFYCHTGFPDVGWNLPELAVRNGVANRVIFTYVCQACQSHWASFFNSAIAHCPRCGQQKAVLANTKMGISHEDMSRVMATFDVYAQVANSEGFGLPQVEAAAVGVPVVATDFSAMADVVRKLRGFPIKCKTVLEAETNCNRAIPDEDDLVNIFNQAYAYTPEERQEWRKDTYEAYKQHYQWDKTCQVWDEAIKKVYNGNLWGQPPQFCDIPTEVPKFRDYMHFLDFCYRQVLKRPDLLYSYDGQQTLNMLSGGFIQEERRNIKRISPKMILDKVINRAEFNNYWEQRRLEK